MMFTFFSARQRNPEVLAHLVLVKKLIRESRQELSRWLSDRRRPSHGLLRGTFNLGHCPICERLTVFVIKDDWLRDFYFCLRCESIPRWRALIHVLEREFPGWRELRIHESSPGGASSEKLKRDCKNYVASHFFPDRQPGENHAGFRCENLERQTFGDAQFDLVITQDVFEHILNPGRAFSEISRTLKPGGAHVFTVPWYSGKTTLVRAIEENGSIRHLQPPDYHGNPIDPNGSLVVTEWGDGLCQFIYEHSGLATTPIRIRDRYLGLDAAFLEVFVSRKSR